MCGGGGGAGISSGRVYVHIEKFIEGGGYVHDVKFMGGYYVHVAKFMGGIMSTYTNLSRGGVRKDIGLRSALLR